MLLGPVGTNRIPFDSELGCTGISNCELLRILYRINSQSIQDEVMTDEFSKTYSFVRNRNVSCKIRETKLRHSRLEQSKT